MSATTAHPARHRRIRGFGHFVLHFFEMCMPMCIGWAVGDMVSCSPAGPGSSPWARSRGWAHGLMMPAMLIPMLLRLDLYTGHAMGART